MINLKGKIALVTGAPEDMERPGFVGRCIAALEQDNQMLQESGRVLLTAELGKKYSINNHNYLP